MPIKPIRLTFPGHDGAELSARLEMPAGDIRIYALFAHCFTCSKDVVAARKIAEALMHRGIAVLRFDFTGLGNSGGDFASTNFTSNLDDLEHAANFLRENYAAPALLIGHSLGGAAMLAVANRIKEAKAIVTIGAPADPEHVTENFSGKLEEIRTSGEAQVELADRPFTIKKQFIEDLEQQNVLEKTGNLKCALLVLHAPLDNIVSVDNARRIYDAAKHPKSFISLDNADHLLSRAEDAAYAATVIAGWASRYIAPPQTPDTEKPHPRVQAKVCETGMGNYQNTVLAGGHRLLVDEPQSVGGMDTGPTPYNLLAAGLGACTSITLRMYADRKKWPLDRVSVEVRYHKESTEDSPGPVDIFERHITLDGNLDEKQRARLIEIANKCPVHRTLENSAEILTREVTKE